MKYLVWLLLLLISGLVLFHAAQNPAYVLIVSPPYKISFSLSFGILALIFSFVLMYSFLRLSIYAFRLPAFLRARKIERQRNVLQGLSQQMLYAWLEGRNQDTVNLAKRILNQDKQHYLAAILAARAEQILGNQFSSEAFLLQAQENVPAQTDLYCISAAFCYLDRDPERVISLLLPLMDRPHLGALPLLYQAQQKLGQTEAADNTLALMQKHQAMQVN